MKGFIDEIDWLNAEPMKYWSFTAATAPEQRKQIVQDAIFSGKYIGARKVDGYYQRLLKDEDGNCFMIARSRNVQGEIVNKIEWLPHMNSWWATLPNGTCFLAECYLPGNEGSKNITSILGCLKEKAIARQDKNPLHFYIFDIMAFNGHNYHKMGYMDRATALRRCAETTDYQNPYIEWAIFYEGEELWNHLQTYLAEGYEGMVIMQKNAPVYFKRTPARVSIKVKKELQETIDVVILGANPPTRLYTGKEIMSWRYWEDIRTNEKLEGALYKRYSDGDPIEPVTKTYWNGWAGSFIIGLYDSNSKKYIPIGSLSGLTEEMLQNWKSYEGKVAEISGMQLMRDNNGKFTGIRHPRLVNLRLDKNPNECLMEQVQ